jgi:hypothetical protein
VDEFKAIPGRYDDCKNNYESKETLTKISKDQAMGRRPGHNAIAIIVLLTIFEKKIQYLPIAVVFERHNNN